MLQTFFRKVISLFHRENCSAGMASQGLKAADEPYGEAPFRTFTRHSLPLLFPALRTVPKDRPFCAKSHYLRVFLRHPRSCTHFPLAFTRRPGATPLLGRRLRAGRTFASPRRLARGFGVESFWWLWSARWPLWGGPSLSAGLRRKASLRQRAVS